MKRHFIIFQRDFQDTSSTIGLVKFHRLGVENRFNTYQEAENFMIDKNKYKNNVKIHNN